MKKNILFFMAFTQLLSLLSIDSILQIPPVKTNTQLRDTHLKFHNDTAEQLWSGADYWAVKFDLTSDFNGEINSFEVEEICVFLQNAPSDSTLTFFVHEDLNGQPNFQAEHLVSQEFQPAEGNNYIQLDETLQSSIFWVALNYQTNSEYRLPASYNDGLHSYYGIAGESHVDYYNMLANGFQSEFLITVFGNAITNGNNLELSEVMLTNSNIGERLTFDVTIDNHSGAVADCYLQLRLEFAADSTYCDSTSLIDTISCDNLNQDLNILTIEESFLLDVYPREYRLIANIMSSEDSTSFNNQKITIFNNYESENPKIFVENFVRLLHNPNYYPSYYLWQDQQEIINQDSIIAINYFSDSLDSLYTEGSNERFIFYELFGYPSTKINGSGSIYGYQEDNYLSYLEESLMKQNTFIEIQNDSEISSISLDHETISVRLDFSNTSSYPLDSTVSNLSAFVALTETMTLISNDQPNLDISGEVLKAIYLDDQNVDLNYDGDYSLNCEIDYSDLIFEHDIVEERDFFNIIYWIQDVQTKEIYYCDNFSLSEVIVENYIDSEHIAPLDVYPNPTTNLINISIENERKQYDKIKYSIFNIKGQLIDSSTLYSDRNSNSISLRELGLSSGIYFIKAEIYSSEQVEYFQQKLLFLK